MEKTPCFGQTALANFLVVKIVGPKVNPRCGVSVCWRGRPATTITVWKGKLRFKRSWYSDHGDRTASAM